MQLSFVCKSCVYQRMEAFLPFRQIRCLEKMEQLDIELICPGHGMVAAKELLGKQKRYFADMRREVKNGIDVGKSLAEITDTLGIR